VLEMESIKSGSDSKGRLGTVSLPVYVDPIEEFKKHCGEGTKKESLEVMLGNGRVLGGKGVDCYVGGGFVARPVVIMDQSFGLVKGGVKPVQEELR